MRTIELPPLSLYVHLPWCLSKCPYCDFNSHAAGDDAPLERYIDALVLDLEAEARAVEGRPVVSIFLGGGTPTLFEPGQIARIVEVADRCFSLQSDAEITIEANPGTVECQDPAGLLAAGVNRLSIGAQSFSDEALARLGRIHAAADIARTVDAARRAGFDNINLDLMYALPGQALDDALADIETAVRIGPEHISWYQLTLEPNTRFHALPPADLPDEDAAAEMQSAGQALLAGHGYRQYEVSAYARDGRRCRHNLNYWTFGDYVAVGAGAHGKLTDADGIRRYRKPAHPRSYMEAIERGESVAVADPVGSRETLFEFMLGALRLDDGFDDRLFEARTGLAASELETAARNASEKGLLERDRADHWRPTALGRRFLNDLQAEFLP